jgi:uncharacterized membrane protein
MLQGIALAQENISALDQTFRSSGKIYVVVAVLTVVMTVLFIYLISIDRKLTNIEKNLDRKKQ